MTRRIIDGPFDLLLGRRTYEIFAAHWQSIEGDQIADAFNRVTKYVATRSLQTLSWKGSVAIRNVSDEVAALKRQDGPTLLVQGSSQLIQTLLASDLIDEFRFLLFQRAGSVTTGSFALEPPTPAEVARQEKLKREFAEVP